MTRLRWHRSVAVPSAHDVKALLRQFARSWGLLVVLGGVGCGDNTAPDGLPDFHATRWRATYSCYDGGLHTGWDSITGIVAESDSIQFDPDGLAGFFTPWSPYYNLQMTMRATGTLYYKDGRVVHGPVPAFFNTTIVADVRPDSIIYYRRANPWRPAHGQPIASEGTSNDSIPPTYVGGNLCDDFFATWSAAVLAPIP